MNIFTAAMIRHAYKAGGLSHAEICLEEAESQLGKEKCAAARAEFRKVEQTQEKIDFPVAASE
jgi:hypothetical protein